MKAIIIGGGSIGRRHANNLASFGIEYRIVDIDEIENIDAILLGEFDMGLVCTPNINHIEHCIKLAEHNIPIFCEKPFYTETNGLDSLLELVNDKELTTMVGCNLRFTPEVNQINPAAKYINAYFGYDLRKWRPGTNHLSSYSANKNLGGGVLLDAIHELDYLYYKFGKIKNITYLKSKLTDVTIDTEDLVVGRITFENDTVADFTLNYLCETYQRYYTILEDGVLKTITFTLDNKMYLDEIQYFVNCIKENKQCMNSFQEASYLLNQLI